MVSEVSPFLSCFTQATMRSKRSTGKFFAGLPRLEQPALKSSLSAALAII